MEGEAIVIDPAGRIDRFKYSGNVPSLDMLQSWVGGYIEAVPGFHKYHGEPCVAFCNEEGKLEGLPFNMEATRLWHVNDVYIGHDVLVGTMVILTGDAAFMEAI